MASQQMIFMREIWREEGLSQRELSARRDCACGVVARPRWPAGPAGLARVRRVGILAPARWPLAPIRRPDRRRQCDIQLRIDPSLFREAARKREGARSEPINDPKLNVLIKRRRGNRFPVVHGRPRCRSRPIPPANANTRRGVPATILRLSDRFGCFVALVARAGVPLAGTSTMMCALSRGTTEVNMNKHVLGGMIAAAVLWPALASAQTTVIETTGSTPPDEVVTYVQREHVPSVAIES